MASVQFGQALGKGLFGTVSPEGVVTLRLTISAVLVWAFVRPTLPRSRREIALTVSFGTAIAGMNVVYLALEHLPVGVAATIQLCGPLGVALLLSRRAIDAGWSILAGSGLALFAVPTLLGGEALSLPGLLLAVVSAVSMGIYVLLSKKAGSASMDGRFLALALVWASLMWAPFGIAADGGSLLTPSTLAVGAIVAVLSAAAPYSLELVALRRMSPRVVGTLQSLEPAVGACAGLIVLGEWLTITQLIAIACVTAASIASVATAARRRPEARAHLSYRGERGLTPKATVARSRRESATRPGRQQEIGGRSPWWVRVG
ncbi:DMT family transporter [Nocardia sp. NPDC060249]|uniref:EamA family transporter n=1 Tax=Nocardia sp. NPDC060249 TaxID=3347082 RepID=UPI0036533794